MASATRPTTKLFTDLRTPLFFAVVWLAAVLVVDGTTFHLAPAIVAGAGAISMASRPIVGASLGLTMALLVTALLSIGGKLTGPTLLPVGGAALESVAAALLGTAVGLLAAVRIEHSHR